MDMDQNSNMDLDQKSNMDTDRDMHMDKDTGMHMDTDMGANTDRDTDMDIDMDRDMDMGFGLLHSEELIKGIMGHPSILSPNLTSILVQFFCTRCHYLTFFIVYLYLL